MTTANPPALAAQGRGARVRRREWTRVLFNAARTGRGGAGLLLAGLIVLIAVVGPALAPHSPTEFVTSSFAPPGHGAPLGGDTLGRDVLSRFLDGGRALLLMALGATAIGVGVGAAAGVSAAYLRGPRESFIMRAVDVLLAFPQVVFALLLVSVVGPKPWLVVLAVGISHAPQVARVLHAAALDVCERDFVSAVELMGFRSRSIVGGEVVPNLVGPLMVETGLRLTYSIIIIAGLSFIGFGIQPPAPNWGTMINENQIGITQNVWAVLVPTCAIAVLTVGLNLYTDAIARVALGVERADAFPFRDEVGDTDFRP